MKKAFKQQVDLVGTFLNEFCEVNGISETELSKHLQIVASYSDYLVATTDIDNDSDVKLGVKRTLRAESGKFLTNIEVFGDYANHADKYPKTTSAILNIKMGRPISATA